MPIGSGTRCKSPKRVSRCIRCKPRIVEDGLLVSGRSCKPAEQRKVILPSKEEYRLARIVGQHAEIPVSICPAPSLVRIGALRECDVVIGCKEVSRDQPPTRREHINVLDAKAIHQPPIRGIFVQFISSAEPPRI